jgi:hypothetical protein
MDTIAEALADGFELEQRVLGGRSGVAGDAGTTNDGRRT